MEQISDTESEPEQFPLEPVVDDTSLEKKPKRKYAKKVKVVEPVDEVKVEKPKRVLTEEHKEKMRLAREASKARKALAQPAPISRQETEAPQAEEDTKPKRKYTRKPKDEVAEVAEPKVVIKEIHHHYAEPKAKKETGEKARKPRVKKETLKQVVPSVDFV
jgi:regulator of replication initiation timing